MSDNTLTTLKLGGRGSKDGKEAEPTSYVAVNLNEVIEALDETQVAALVASAVHKAIVAGVGVQWRADGMPVFEKDEPQAVTVDRALAFVAEALSPRAAAASATQRAKNAEAALDAEKQKSVAMTALIAAMTGGDPAEVKAAKRACKALGIDI